MAETDLPQNGEGEGPWDEGDELEEGDEDQDQMQPPGSGPYATLSVEGPQMSAGATGHPDSCMPCTFYCFTRRGCNRGLDCRFCHLTHQSKLQQRREAWKKQQREKRKSIRERVAAEALARRHTPGSKGAALEAGMGDGGRGAISNAGGCNPALSVAKTIGSYNLPGGERQNDMQAVQPSDAGMGNSVFCYTPSRSILTIGQDVEFRPQLAAPPTNFRLKAPLPPGLVLDPKTGVIHGAPSASQTSMTAIVEADFLGARSMRATMELEVVDFTRGGFVIGHMSEFEPGKFMLLLYVPDEGNGDKRGNHHAQGAGNGAIKGMAGNGLSWDPGCMQVAADADAPRAHGQGEWWAGDGSCAGSQQGGGDRRRANRPLARAPPQVQAQVQPDWW